MSEQLDWGTETQDKPKAKKRVPTWAWFCGGGCLIALIAAAVFAFFAVKIGRTAFDQEAQWAKLGEVLPHDPLPPDIRIVGMSWIPGVEHAWQLQRGEDLLVQVFVLSGAAAGQLREQMATPEDAAKLKELAGLLGETNGSAGTLSIQGREVNFARFTPAGDTDAEPSEDEDGEDRGVMKQIGRSLNPPTVMLDLSKEGDADFVLFSYKRITGVGPVGDEELLEFLAPFHIGPDR